ncbi:hypothetical protein [Rhodococcus opacus]|uniref:hypothetical protein n=1 Tax=Rhodococcus opacus TaxID=37919 RepID=UPI0018C8AD14|nr:hypothetical protein [Rhodococcus opacus]
MSTVVDLDTGLVLGVVDGRDNKGVGAWLAARPQAWRDRIEVVAIVPPRHWRKRSPPTCRTPPSVSMRSTS